MSRLAFVPKAPILASILVLAALAAGCPQPPVVEFSAWPRDNYDPMTVAFTDASDPGTETITSWYWHFGDGGTSTLQNPSHTYTTPGVYEISLTASSSADSNTLTRTGYITVRDADVDALILHRYEETVEEAEDVAEALASRGLTSRIFWRLPYAYSRLTSLDLSRPGMILLCSDVSGLETAELTHLRDSGKSILATGGSHHVFADMGLHIASAAATTDRRIVVALATHEVFTTPNDMGVTNGQEVNLYLTGTSVTTTDIYLGEIPDSADVTVLASSPGDASYARLVMEDDLYMVWGFRDHFDRLSVPGLDLLENCVRYLMD